jgi:hypothetical protein
MPLDTKSLKEGRFQAVDGRTYPDYLRPYERFDGDLLAKVAQLREPTLNQITQSADSPRQASAVSPWLSSAEWRGLLDRVDEDELAGKRRYRLSSLGRELLAR